MATTRDPDRNRKYKTGRMATQIQFYVPFSQLQQIEEIRLYCKVRGIRYGDLFVESAYEKIQSDPTWKDELRNLLIQMQNAETQDTTD